MSTENIRSSIQGTISYLKANPEEAFKKATAARAVLEGGLKVRTTGPEDEVIISDMPPTVGGEGSAPTPGWFMQAALATCNATGIAMKAAQEGIELTTLEVSIDTESDTRGIFGFDESIKAGPLNMRTRVRIGAEGVPEEKLHEIVKWNEKYSWVGNAICRAVPLETEVEIL
ncbi:MAG: OsmC family protein [Desulfobacteraceae bacterium]|nr:OsmC family protein [Desulfobacteraceae bacterium]